VAGSNPVTRPSFYASGQGRRHGPPRPGEPRAMPNMKRTQPRKPRTQERANRRKAKLNAKRRRQRARAQG
ncbi:MAG: hypothetical protein ACREDH_12380, partial [Methylocella sp.]